MDLISVGVRACIFIALVAANLRTWAFRHFKKDKNSKGKGPSIFARPQSTRRLCGWSGSA